MLNWNVYTWFQSKHKTGSLKQHLGADRFSVPTIEPLRFRMAVAGNGWQLAVLKVGVQGQFHANKFKIFKSCWRRLVRSIIWKIMSKIEMNSKLPFHIPRLSLEVWVELICLCVISVQIVAFMRQRKICSETQQLCIFFGASRIQCHLHLQEQRFAPMLWDTLFDRVASGATDRMGARWEL